MKHNVLRRVLALILVFAMTFSLASMAFAADVSDNVEVIEDASASDTIETGESAEDGSGSNSAEDENTGDSSASAEGSYADSSAGTADAADSSANAGDTSAAEEAEEAADDAESEQLTEETEVTEEEDEIYDASTTGTYKGSDGNIYYRVNGVTLRAKNVSDTYEYHWYGNVLYRFSQDNEDEATGYATGTKSYSTSVLITEAPASGTYADITLDQVYFVKNGVPTTDDNKYHWYLDTDGVWKLYYFKNSATYTWSVGTAYTGVVKITGSINEALQETYDVGSVYYMKNGVGVADDNHFHWYNNKLYIFNNSSTQKAGISTGKLYTGVVKITGSLSATLQKTYDVGSIYYMKSGVGVEDDGHFHWYGNKLYIFNNSSTQKAGISTGKLYTGGVKITGSLSATLQKTYDVGSVYYMKNGVGVKDDGSYHWYNNKLYYFDNSSSQKAGISTGTLYSGTHYCGTIPSTVTGYTAERLYTFTKGVGTLFTGVYKTYYYKNGVKTKTTGWVKYNNNYYYFKSSNKCITDTSKAYKLKGIGNSSKSYYYYFKSSGVVWKNLFSKSAAYKSKKMKIYVDDSDHNTTFLLYNSTSKSYDLAGLQVICSTPKTRDGVNGLKYATYYLSCQYRYSWAQNEAQNKWYCYFTHLNTTGGTKTPFGFHSPQYYKKSYHSLVTSNYNKFGSNNTGGCIRLQTGYVSLVYSISQKNTYKNVVVYYGKYSKKYSPFAIVKNADIQIPSSQNYDPTTPSSKL